MRMRRGLIGPLLLLFGAWLLLRDRLDVVEVRGRSMAPTLLPGDRLLLVRLARPPRAGEVVVTPDPRHGERELIKRVAAVDGFGVTLRGDNPAFSTDARAFGTIEPSAVRWRAVLRSWPRDRIGPIPAAPEELAETGGESSCALPDALLGH
jgi:nickel-type superoxide dismutase maturation protease